MLSFLTLVVLGVLSSICQGETGNVTPDCIRQYMGSVNLSFKTK